jgi:hypothetical protein
MDGGFAEQALVAWTDGGQPVESVAVLRAHSNPRLPLAELVLTLPTDAAPPLPTAMVAIDHLVSWGVARVVEVLRPENRYVLAPALLDGPPVVSDPALAEAYARDLEVEGEIHRVDPDVGSTLTVSNRDSQSNFCVNWKIMRQPCGFQVWGRCMRTGSWRPSPPSAAVARAPLPRSCAAAAAGRRRGR